MRAIFPIVTVAVLALLPSPLAHAQDYSCGYSRTASAYAGPAASTNSNSFVALTELATEVGVADGTRCAIVLFSGQVRTQTPGGVRIRLTVNGEPRGLPSSTDFSTSGKTDERAVTFIIPRLSGADPRTFGIEYMSIDGKPVSISKSHLQVLYYVE